MSMYFVQVRVAQITDRIVLWVACSLPGDA